MRRRVRNGHGTESERPACVPRAGHSNWVRPPGRSPVMAFEFSCKPRTRALSPAFGPEPGTRGTAPNRRRTARAGTVYEVKPNDERARATGARGVDRSLMFAGRRPRQSAGPRRGAQTPHHPRTPARTVIPPHGSTYSARLHRHETTHCDDTLVTRVSMEDGHNEVRNSITTPHHKPQRRWSMHRKARDYEHKHEQRAGRSTRARAHHSLQGSITSHNSDRSDQAPFRHTFRLRTRSRDVHFPT